MSMFEWKNSKRNSNHRIEQRKFFRINVDDWRSFV
jgi:hypothetical protein